MFSLSIMDGLKVRSTVLACGAAGVLALTGQAMAAERIDHTHSGLVRGGDHGRGSDHRGFDRGGFDRSRVSFGFGFSNFGSGISLGFGNGFRGSFSSRFYAPFYVGAGAYCAPTYYSPVVSYCNDYPYSYSPYSYSYPQETVYVTGQPLVQRPVLVASPVAVDQPAATQFAVSQPMSASYQMPTPAPAQPEAGRYKDRELGDAYLRMGDADNATRVYKKYLSAWNGDGTAMRNLGFAEIVRGDVQDGFRAVVQGYKIESNLVNRPIRPDDVGGALGFQKLLDGAARGASSTNTAEGWLTVALLQNTAGQRDAAINALQRSRDAGLDQGLLDQFTPLISTPTTPAASTPATPTPSH